VVQAGLGAARSRSAADSEPATCAAARGARVAARRRTSRSTQRIVQRMLCGDVAPHHGVPNRWNRAIAEGIRKPGRGHAVKSIEWSRGVVV